MDLCIGTTSRFLLVGGSGVMVNSAALLVLHQLAGLPLVLASTIAVELAIANNFIWNDRWTFGRAKPSLVRFARFNLVSLLSLVVTTATASALVWQTGVHYLVANLIGIVLATACNLIFSVAWTWRRP